MRRVALCMVVLSVAAGCQPNKDSGSPTTCQGTDLNLVITEIIPDPNLASDAEWFEVYNAGTSDLPLAGLGLYRIDPADNSTDDTFFVPDTNITVLAPGEYAILGAGLDTESNILPDVVLGDKLPLSSDKRYCVFDGYCELDCITMGDDGIGDPGGSHSMSLDPAHLSAEENDDAANWCLGSTLDVDEDYASPSAANPTCPEPVTCPDPSALVNLVPTEALFTTDAEYIELYNAGDTPIPMSCILVGDATGMDSDDACAGEIAPGAYGIFANNPVNYAAVFGGAACDYGFSLNSSGDTLQVGFLDLAGAEHVAGSVVLDAPSGDGVALQLNPEAGEAWTVDSNWCDAADEAVSGYFGSPGVANGPCGGSSGVVCPDVVDLRVNEVLLSSDAEYIEIYNAGRTAVPISCVVLGDATGADTNNCVGDIPPGGFGMFAGDANLYASTFGGTACDYSYNLNTSGDTVQLAYLDSTNTTHTLGSLDFDGAADQTAWQLDINANTWNDLTNWCEAQNEVVTGFFGSPGDVNEACPPPPTPCPASADLIATEVQLDADVEYIEVLNQGADIPLHCIVLGDAISTHADSNCSGDLPSGGYAVFSDDPTGYASTFGLSACEFTFTLNNSGDTVRVGHLDASGTEHILDEVTLGSAPDTNTAWELDPGTDWTDANNWCGATTLFASIYYGSPGVLNAGCGGGGVNLGDVDADGTPAVSDCDDNDAAVTSIYAQDLLPGQLVINEVMWNNSLGTNGEWFEVINQSGRCVDLNGLTVEDASTAWTLSTPTPVAAGAYVLFAYNGDSNLNGGLPTVNVDYGTVNLNTAGDVVAVSYNGTTLDSVDGTIANFPVTTDAASALDPAFANANDNDSASHWTTATNSYGASFGTPGAANP